MNLQPQLDLRPPTSPAQASARGNALLDALPATTLQRWSAMLQPVTLAHGAVLAEAGGTPLFALFPVDAVVSLLYITREGATSEVAVIGRHGMFGMPLLMGGDNSSLRAQVQTAGVAWRLPGGVLRAEARHPGPTLTLLLRQVQALAAQMAQTAACNRHHALDQQLCRRLLMGLDCSDRDELLLTHEAAAQLLGVRREGVTAAALKLQQAGIIRYHRGRIEVLSRRRLQARSCECYASTRQEQRRLLPELDLV